MALCASIAPLLSAGKTVLRDLIEPADFSVADFARRLSHSSPGVQPLLPPNEFRSPLAVPCLVHALPPKCRCTGDHAAASASPSACGLLSLKATAAAYDRAATATRILRGELEKMTTTMEVSETLERVDNIVNMLDEICDRMDGLETLRTWRYVMQETYESAGENKDD
jgi:hypothetical protein